MVSSTHFLDRQRATGWRDDLDINQLRSIVEELDTANSGLAAEFSRRCGVIEDSGAATQLRINDLADTVAAVQRRLTNLHTRWDDRIVRAEKKANSAIDSTIELGRRINRVQQAIDAHTGTDNKINISNLQSEFHQERRTNRYGVPEEVFERFTDAFSCEPPKLDDNIANYLDKLRDSTRKDSQRKLGSRGYSTALITIKGLITRGIKQMLFPPTPFNELSQKDTNFKDIVELEKLTRISLKITGKAEQIWLDLIAFLEQELKRNDID